MIREADFIAYDLGTDDRIEDVPLGSVRDKMRALTPPSRRLPIRNALGAVMCVVHDATLTAYAESVNQTTETLDKTMGDLLKDPGFNTLVKAMGFVSERATVADARAKMGSIKNCNDVTQLVPLLDPSPPYEDASGRGLTLPPRPLHRRPSLTAGGRLHRLARVLPLASEGDADAFELAQ